jgi:ribokinase
LSAGVVVVGSANVDLVYRVSRFPLPGETVDALSLNLYPGGKGLNQAVAARRAGISTTFIASLGDDPNSELITSVLTSEHIVSALRRRSDAPTGTAVILIDDSGENNIVLLAGANSHLAALTDDDRNLIRQSAVLVCQLEVPTSGVEDALKTARDAGTKIVLNPAPVRALSASILAAVDVLVVNEHEADQLGVDELRMPCVITTLGPAGALLAIRGAKPVRIPARKTVAIDTVGAGDTFVGAFAAEVARGADYESAARRACIAASLSVETEGAVPSIPTRNDVDEVIGLEKVGSQ